jgi:hypothetical protein
MPNAVITSTTFSADGTQASIINQLNTAMLTAGFTQIDSFVTAGNEQRVWQFDADPADTLYGKMTIHGGFSATTTLRVRGYSSYTPATDSGLNESTTSSTGAAALTSTYTLYICNHPEVRGVIMMEGSTFRKFFGYMRPSVKPPAWGDFTYGFMDSGTNPYVSSSLQTISSLRPATVSVSIGTVGYINNTTPNIEIWNGRPFITNCLLSDITNTKPIAFFSNDIISVGMSGMNILNEFFNPITNSTYTIFDNPGASSRMAIKTAGA